MLRGLLGAAAKQGELRAGKFGWRDPATYVSKSQWEPRCTCTITWFDIGEAGVEIPTDIIPATAPVIYYVDFPAVNMPNRRGLRFLLLFQVIWIVLEGLPLGLSER